MSQPRGDRVNNQRRVRWCLLTILTHTDLFRVACLDFEHDGAYSCAHILSLFVFFTQTPTDLNSVPLPCSSAPGQRAWQCTGGLAGSFSPLKSWRKKTNYRHLGLGCGEMPRTPHGRRYFLTMMYELLPSPCCTFPCLFCFLYPLFFALFPSFSIIDILFASPQCLRCFSNWYLWRRPIPLRKLYSSSLYRGSISRMLQLTVKGFSCVYIWVCLVLAAIHWTAYVLPLFTAPFG